MHLAVLPATTNFPLSSTHTVGDELGVGGFVGGSVGFLVTGVVVGEGVGASEIGEGVGGQVPSIG